MKANTVKKVDEKSLPAWFRVCEFNPQRDIHEVEQGLAVDINEALRTGVVKDNEYNLNYNNISEPSNIVGRINNTFDAIEAQRVIKKYGKKANVDTVVTAGAGEVPSSASAPSNAGSE